MKQNISKKLDNRKKKIAKRTGKRSWKNQSKPMLTCPNITYDVDGRNRGIANGGIGIIHQLVERAGLATEIYSCLELFGLGSNFGHYWFFSFASCSRRRASRDLPNTLWMPVYAGMTRRRFF